jgi:hypothetical protein
VRPNDPITPLEEVAIVAAHAIVAVSVVPSKTDCRSFIMPLEEQLAEMSGQSHAVVFDRLLRALMSAIEVKTTLALRFHGIIPDQYLAGASTFTQSTFRAYQQLERRTPPGK